MPQWPRSSQEGNAGSNTSASSAFPGCFLPLDSSRMKRWPSSVKLLIKQPSNAALTPVKPFWTSLSYILFFRIHPDFLSILSAPRSMEETGNSTIIKSESHLFEGCVHQGLHGSFSFHHRLAYPALDLMGMQLWQEQMMTFLGDNFSTLMKHRD